MTELAPDPAVPRRNALLRPLTMAEVLSQRLHGGVPVERCERTYVKYRVGDSLRVVYRYQVDGVTRHVSARTQRKAPAPAVPAPEVGAVLFPFPYDRKLPALPALAPGSPTLENLLGTPVTPRLVSYAAEQSAAAACVDAGGRVLAYAKVQRDDGERRGTEALATRTPCACRAELRPRGRRAACSRRSRAAGSTTWTRSTARCTRSGAASAACTRWPSTSPASNASTCRGWRRPRP